MGFEKCTVQYHVFVTLNASRFKNNGRSTSAYLFSTCNANTSTITDFK